MSHADAELTAALERALIRELVAEWRRINAIYFKDALTLPSIELSTGVPLGRWVDRGRILELSRAMILEQPWGVAVEVLKHEMAHQYVHEVLTGVDESAHGPAFRDVCARLGIDAAAAGMPRPHVEASEARAIERIARLLALAESSNVHEAEAAMSAAQRLMLKHNLSVTHEAAVRAGYSFRHLGRPSGRVTESERILASILAKHFFVEVIWIPVYRPLVGKRGSVLEICGSPANLEMAEYVHSYLTHAADRSWDEHKRVTGIRSNRDRRTFLAGVMTGFEGKLAREAKKHQSEGLVWVKDADLSGFFRRRHPHIRNVRYGGMRKNETWEHGREAGRKLILHRAVKDGGGEADASARGRLLGPRR
jgi:hypothetical protein